MFYDKLFSSLDFTLPRAATGRRGFPKEAMVCAFIVMKCEGFAQITDLMDYLDNNRIIAHYCGFNIMEPLPSYWTYDRFLKKMDNAALKEIMAAQVKKLYEMGIVDTSFIGLDSTPVMANTKQNNPKSFAKNKFSKENHPKSDPDCALGVHSAANQHNERRYEFYWGYKSHVLVDCISGLPLYELTTPGNIADSFVAAEILAAANQTVSLKGCTFLADKGYDVKSIYNTVKTVYEGEAFIPLNPRGKPQYAGPHLRFSGRVGRRSARLSLLPFCQTASAFRLICLFHTFFRRGVYRATVFAPLRRPKLFRFPVAVFLGSFFRPFCSSHWAKRNAFFVADLRKRHFRCDYRDV